MSKLSGTPGTEPASELAAQREMLRRQRRVWRNVLIFVFVMAVMVWLSMAERDKQAVRGTIQECSDTLEFARQRLQQAYERTELAPGALPLPPAVEIPPDASPAERERLEDERLEQLLRYAYLPGHREQAVRYGEAFVAHCAQPHHLYLHGNLRHVIVFDGTQYELRQMGEAEFRRRAEELGLEVLD